APSNPTLTVGGTQQFTATGTYSDGSRKEVTTQVAWASSAPNVTVISPSGLATAEAPGTATISATVGSVAGSTGLTVVAGPPTITTPAPPAAAAGGGHPGAPRGPRGPPPPPPPHPPRAPHRPPPGRSPAGRSPGG